jgi:hypothetical protein
MEFFFWLAALVAALVTFQLGKNLWTRLAWRCFGWWPKLLDEDRFLMTVVECSDGFLARWSHECQKHGRRLDADEALKIHQCIAGYTASVIERYIQNFMLPRWNVRFEKADVQPEAVR